MSIFMKWFI